MLTFAGESVEFYGFSNRDRVHVIIRRPHSIWHYRSPHVHLVPEPRIGRSCRGAGRATDYRVVDYCVLVGGRAIAAACQRTSLTQIRRTDIGRYTLASFADQQPIAFVGPLFLRQEEKINGRHSVAHDGGIHVVIGRNVAVGKQQGCRARSDIDDA